MKIAFVADVHLGNRQVGRFPVGQDGLNTRGSLAQATLARAVSAAREAGASVFVVLGDLFDTWRPEPAVLARTIGVLSAPDLGVVVVPGNHDMPDKTARHGNTACEPLAVVADVVRSPRAFDLGGVALFCVPFTAEQSMGAELSDSLAGHLVTSGILAAHVGIAREGVPWERSSAEAVTPDVLFGIMDRVDLARAFVGNFHHHRVWRSPSGAEIVQVGTLCPGSFSDAGVFPDVGGMAVYDSDTGRTEMVEVPGPRFVPELPARASPDECSYFVRDLAGGAESARVVLVPEADDPVSAPPPPAGPPGDVRQAVSQYVAAMALPDGVDRAAVEAASLSYLAAEGD